MQAAYAVALVDRRKLPLGEWAACLSVRERAEAATYRHPGRRARAITSRLLTKYLMTHPREPEFRRLGANEIEVVRSSPRASVELFSGEAQAEAEATVSRAGNASSD